VLIDTYVDRVHLDPDEKNTLPIKQGTVGNPNMTMTRGELCGFRTVLEGTLYSMLGSHDPKHLGMRRESLGLWRRMFVMFLK
jgi:hypothetical protein